MKPAGNVLLLLLAFLFAAGFKGEASASSSIFSPYIEKKALGWIDWDEGYIYGVGRGYLDKNGGSKQRAMGAASLVAAGNIVKLAADLTVDDKKTLKEVGGGRVVIELKAFLRAQEYSSKLIPGVENCYEVVQKAPLHGVSGISARLITQLGGGEFHPLPDLQERSGEEGVADGDLPWLVLDARKLSAARAASPALFPKIVNERGAPLYQLNSADQQTVASRGMVRYVTSTASPAQIRQAAAPGFGLIRLWRRLELVPAAYAGEKNPVRVKREQFIVVDVKSTQGLKNTNLVVSEADANQLRAEDNATKILQKCRVMVLVSGKVGGVEGRLGQPLLFAALAP